MTRRDDGGVVFVVEGGAAEVNEPHRGVVYPPLAALLGGAQKQRPQTLLSKDIYQQLKENFRSFSMLS